MSKEGLDDVLIDTGLVMTLPTTTVVPAMIAPVPTLKVVSAMTLVKEAEELFEGEELDALDDAQRLFLVALAKHGTKRAACVASGVKMVTVNRWMRANGGDNAFAALYVDTLELAGDALEEEAIKQAMGGSEKLMTTLLKAFKPDKYADRKVSKSEQKIDIEVRSWADLAKQVVDAEVKGAVSGAIIIDGEVVEDGDEQEDTAQGAGGGAEDDR